MKSNKFIGAFLLFATMLCFTSMSAQIKVQSKSLCSSEVTMTWTDYTTETQTVPSWSVAYFTPPAGESPCNIQVYFDALNYFSDLNPTNCGVGGTAVSDQTCWTDYSWWGPGYIYFSYY